MITDISSARERRNALSYFENHISGTLLHDAFVALGRECGNADVRLASSSGISLVKDYTTGLGIPSALAWKSLMSFVTEKLAREPGGVWLVEDACRSLSSPALRRKPRGPVWAYKQRVLWAFTIAMAEARQIEAGIMKARHSKVDIMAFSALPHGLSNVNTDLELSDEQFSSLVLGINTLVTDAFDGEAWLIVSL